MLSNIYQKKRSYTWLCKFKLCDLMTRYRLSALVRWTKDKDRWNTRRKKKYIYICYSVDHRVTFCAFKNVNLYSTRVYGEQRTFINNIHYITILYRCTLLPLSYWFFFYFLMFFYHFVLRRPLEADVSRSTRIHGLHRGYHMYRGLFRQSRDRYEAITIPIIFYDNLRGRTVTGAVHPVPICFICCSTCVHPCTSTRMICAGT